MLTLPYHTALMQDALLVRILGDAAQTPDYRALCLVAGGAHGYHSQTLALQQIDRRFRLQSWFSAGEVTPWQDHPLDLDIDRELAASGYDVDLWDGEIDRVKAWSFTVGRE